MSKTLLIHAFWVSLALGVSALALPASSTSNKSAVISRATPGVVLRDGSIGAEPHPARPLVLIAPGSVLQLPEGSEAVVICADDRAVELKGSARWQLGTDSCSTGKKLPAGTHASLIPRQGRSLVFHGSLLMEAPSRSDDENGKVPVLVRPRSPQRSIVEIADSAPTIVWTAVDKALHYEIGVVREDWEEVFRFDSRSCRRDELTTPLWSCSAPWPSMPLQSGEKIEIRIRALTPDPDRPVRIADPGRVRLVDARAQARLRTELGALERAGLADEIHLLRARIYSESGLFNEAAESLHDFLENSPTALIAVFLGDLYLGLGQQRVASNLYAHAESLLPRRGDDATRAALYLGRGRLLMRRNEVDLAARALEKAARLFERLGLDADAHQAANEAELAQRSQ